MRKLGLIGGMSWVSTRAYYERINRHIQQARSTRDSAPLLIESLEYAPLYAVREEEEWDRAAATLIDSARRLESAGAGAIVIAANSMHRVYDRVAEAIGVDIIHIADTVGEALAEAKIEDAVLIGTRNVMTESFFRQRIVKHGVNLIAPEEDDVEMVDSIIFKELMLGKVTRDAERALKTIITRKEQRGADAIVLACTELGLVVDTDANVLPVFDTTDTHCRAAAEWILAE
ncbi:amino acid racemase [Qipengyuania sp. DY56-A-20]|uniref:Amino acid racemase n=1 Tax=Qipengyuania benthica TaxID=3067651 RepID=A0ABT9H6P7_9SPHN|nr:amino acid racemase [Qipengyuania sp. DY56-A-20]MDP4538995.1 amino acid racemase [Qipengyuania sp. DY56-A-20]